MALMFLKHAFANIVRPQKNEEWLRFHSTPRGAGKKKKTCITNKSEPWRPRRPKAGARQPRAPRDGGGARPRRRRCGAEDLLRPWEGGGRPRTHPSSLSWFASSSAPSGAQGRRGAAVAGHVVVADVGAWAMAEQDARILWAGTHALER